MKHSLSTLLTVFLLVGNLGLQSQEDSAQTDAAIDKPDAEEKEPKEKTIEELVEDSELIKGLLSLYRDTKTGELRLLLKEGQLDQEYLYFSYAENGVSDAGFLTRGAYQVSTAKVFVIRRYFDRLEFIEKNTNYYFDPESAISKASNANISDSLFFQQKIEVEDKATGDLLVKVDGLFLAETFYQIAPLPNPDKKPHKVFSLGSLSKDKSKIRSIKNYPKNTDIIVEYVYENSKPFVQGSPAVTDPRNVSVVVQHTILRAPENPIEPRSDDPRVGYFGHQITDLSSTDVTPYRDLIKRWRLEKKDPKAKLSEPVKPIVYWLENTTPVELREIIRDAALTWNEAFEQAGFKNAIEIKIQPDDADWDAGDIRYNVIRWVSSPNPFYGGYGPSFHDPRSGEILGADIMLEHIVIGARLLTSDVLGDGTAAPSKHTQHHCMASMYARNETLFGMAALEALGGDSEEKERLLEEFLYFLTLHEIGHTLGLNHNFRSSYLHSLQDIYDTASTYSPGLYGSVMDYPAVPFALPGKKQGQYYTTRPGPYDLWAIEFGYKPVNDPSELEAILSRSTEPELAFANDADDMRSPGKAIDPRAMINDLTSDPIGFSIDQIELIKTVQPRFQERLLKDGESYQYFLNGYELSIRRFRDAVTSISRHIGGIYVDRAMVGQNGASSAPLTPVPLGDQTRAMESLNAYLFSPEAFNAFDDSAHLLLAQRRGFDHYDSTEDPKLHQVALDIHKSILNHLLHAKVLARITDSSLYGNEYRIDAFFEDLTKAVFDQDLNTEVNTFRQNLQLEYVDRLIKIIRENHYDPVSQSMALNRLRWIEENTTTKSSDSLLTRAHREHIRYKIQEGLNND